jgi:hypothetical protein
MKNKTPGKKIFSFVFLIALCLAGMFIGYTLRSNAIIVRGILGISVLYFYYRTFSSQSNVDEYKNIKIEFIFPRNIKEVITTLIYSMVLFLALQQLLDVVLSLI